jgi:hypothetical protein
VIDLHKLRGNEDGGDRSQLQFLLRLRLINVHVEVVDELNHYKEDVAFLHFADLCAMQDPID